MENINLPDSNKIVWQRDIPIERNSGITRCTYARTDNMEREHILALFGLLPKPDELVEFSPSKAQTILESLLWKDMAYGVEIMPVERARQLALQFIESQTGAGTTFLSNADWSGYGRTPTGFSWAEFTNSTFDGGIIALSADCSACVWFEDED